jgi:hypothetical protein
LVKSHDIASEIEKDFAIAMVQTLISAFTPNRYIRGHRQTVMRFKSGLSLIGRPFFGALSMSRREFCVMSRGYPRKQQAAFGCWSAPFSAETTTKVL